MVDAFEYVFPAIRGVQAGREHYVSMCPLRLIPKIFLFDEEELVPELRAQRTLNKNRLPEIVRYIVDAPKDYVFSAITASVDGEVAFDPMGEGGPERRLGLLRIPMSARFIINDGQHRRAAIELALRERPELADESISVVFFLDIGLERCQQMFADLNRHAVWPSRSIGVLYDHRDDLAIVTRLFVMNSSVFRDLVEMERTTLSPRSRRLFTLSSLYGALRELFHGVEGTRESHSRTAQTYLEAVEAAFPEWTAVRERRLSAGEVRRDFIHSHGIVLQALGRVGNTLLRTETPPDEWPVLLAPLADLDWSRTSALWEGRAMVAGRVSKGYQNVVLTTNAIRLHLGFLLSAEEQAIEDDFRRANPNAPAPEVARV